MSIPRNLSKLADGADSSGVLKVDSGGTGATTAADALTNLGAIGNITSNDGSVVVSTTGTTKDLSVGIAGSTATLISQVRNETGVTLTKGTVVYISGAAGNKALVSKAIATSDATSAQTYGMVQADISNNNNGYVVVIGVVSGLNTSAFAEGVQLYLSPTTAGTYTSTKPYAPLHLVYVGVVTRSHANQGTIEVKIQNGYEMDELHDVSAQSPSNGDTLVYVSSTDLWTKTPQSSLSVASAAAVPFSGVTGKPTTLSGYGITDAYSSSNPAGYISGITSGNVTTALGYTPYNSTNPSNYINTSQARSAISVTGAGSYDSATGVINIVGGVTSFNTRTGAITLGSSDVTGALGFTPYNSSNPSGYISGITSGNVTTALGYTPYNSSNPAGYITSSALSGYAPLTGTGASGTWSINVTGSAGSATTAAKTSATTIPASTSFSKWLFATSSTGGVLNWNDQSNTIPGVGTTLLLGNASNGPGDGNYYHPFNIEYSSNDGTGQITQMAIAYGTPANELYMRGRYAGTWSNWVRFLNTSNFNSFSPTLTGSGASGTWGIRITGFANAGTPRLYASDGSYTYDGANPYYMGMTYDGSRWLLQVTPGTPAAVRVAYSDLSGNSSALSGYAASTFVGQRGNTYNQVDTWLQLNGNYGFYAPSFNAAHFYPNNQSTYGTWAISGNRNGYSGIHDTYSNVQTIMYDSSGNGGVYREANGRWYWYYLLANDCLGIGTSTTSATYGVYCNKGAYFGGRTDAPILYDSNNTGYYLDPNSTSQLYNATFENYIGVGGVSPTARMSGTSGVSIYHANYPAVGFATASGPDYLIYRGGDGAPLSVWNASGSQTVFFETTFTRFTGSARAPIFYDLDNTGYYVDPASGSNFGGDVVRSNISQGNIYLTGSLPGYAANTYPTLRTDGTVLYFAAAGVYSGYWSTYDFVSRGNVTAYSDETLKTNWRNLPDNFVEKLSKVKHGIYDRIDTGLTQEGVSAQSLQPLLPNSVLEGVDKKLTVNYGSAAMVSAVELAKEVVSLNTRIAQLEALINKLIKE